MSTRRSLCIRTFAFTTLTLLAAGCAARNSGGESTDSQDQADSTEANASNAQSSHFTEMFAGSVPSSDPQAAADANASVAVGSGWPAGCATRAKDPTNPLVVVVTLNDCTGPFGLVKVSGQLIATFSKSAGGGLHVDVASRDLTANGHAVLESGAGDIGVSGTTRTVAWKGAWTRENLKDETVAHTTNVTLTVDTATGCRTANGTAQTNVGTREIDSAIDGYAICRLPSGADGCPTGEISHTRAKTGATLTIDFDGTAEAKITGPRGNSIEVPLVCLAQ